MSTRRSLRAIVALSAAWAFGSGCACDDTPTKRNSEGEAESEGEADPCLAEGSDGGVCGPERLCCAATGDCFDDPHPAAGQTCANPSSCSNAEDVEGCAPGYCLGFADPDADAWDEDRCEVSPVPCACVEAPPLVAGLMGRHSSLAMAGGVAHVAAYEDEFGDLVIGVSEDLDQIAWSIVDGVPDVSPTNGPSGWRGGISARGDDVGNYTSIAIGSDGAVRISYTDSDNGTLKLARASKAADPDGGDGTGWAIHVVDAVPGAAVGWHSALLLGEGDVPVVGYEVHGIEDDGGVWHSQARVATALSATPLSAKDWTVEVLEDVVIACTGLCGSDEVCRVDGWICAEELAEEECGSACAGDEVCADVGGAPACTAVVPDPTSDDVLDGVGLFMALALHTDGRPATAYYHHLPESGEVHERHYDGAAWVGSIVDAGDTVDVGEGLSMTIDASDVLHLAYVDAYDAHALVYTQWSESGGVLAREIADDGVRGEGDVHPVGADSTIAIGDDGNVRVVYQDQQSSDLVLATRTDVDTWEVSALAEGALGYGFYSDFGSDETGLYVSTFYYDALSEPPGGVKLFVVP